MLKISIDRENIPPRKVKLINNLQPKTSTLITNNITTSRELFTKPKQNNVRKRVRRCR